MLSPGKSFQFRALIFVTETPVPVKSPDLELDTDIPAPTRALRTSSRLKARAAKDTGKPFKAEWFLEVQF